MNLTPQHRAVLSVIRTQYPGSITARSITMALSAWRMKERQVNNILNELCKAGYIRNEKSNGAALYIANANVKVNA